MFTFEFNAEVRDGKIKIPNKYIKNIGTRVKVIIVSEEVTQKNVKPGFNSIRLNTKGFKFDRNVANER